MTTRGADELMLVAIPTAACCARMFAAATLSRWGVPPGEPVLNAVEILTVLAVDASKPDLLGYAPDHLNTLYVRLMRLDGAVLVEVWDRNPVTYTLPELPGVADKGYRVVEGGKAAWAAVPCR